MPRTFFCRSSKKPCAASPKRRKSAPPAMMTAFSAGTVASGSWKAALIFILIAALWPSTPRIPRPLARPLAVSAVITEVVLGLVPRRKNSNESILRRARFPLVEKVQNVFGCHRARRFELPAFLAEEQLPVAFQHRDCGDASVERHIILFRNVQVLVHLADIHVHHFKRFLHRGRNFRAVERFLEYVAVVAPVPSKDDKHSLAPTGGLVDSRRNFRFRIR